MGPPGGRALYFSLVSAKATSENLEKEDLCSDLFGVVSGCHAEAESVGSGLQAEGRGGINTSPEHQGLNSFGDEKGFVKA